MMKAVRRNHPLWAGTGSTSVGGGGVESASGQDGGVGSANTPLDRGQGRVSDLALRPPNASSQASQGRRPLQNAAIPPVTFPGGRNPYLDRPLPAPPSKNIAAFTSTTPFNMPARPSTSSGPGSSKTAGSKPNFDKRISKDDMALTGQQMGTATSKEAGLPPAARALWLLVPEHSTSHRKRTPSPPRMVSPPGGLLTPQSSASGEIPIGMALGSPARDTTPRANSSSYVSSPQPGWLPQSQTWVEARPSAPQAPTSEPTVQRTKTQKRRLFGLFGSRRHAEPPKVAEAAEGNRSTSSIAPSASSEDAVPVRSNTVAGTRVPKHKPIIVNPRPEPPQPDAIAEEPGEMSISRPILTAGPSTGGFLNVDIPDIRLERYSVMFSGVLNPNGTKSSLLERRQATLEKLKTINDNDAGHDRIKPRRATSPQPMKSPAFSLFPQTPSRQSGFVAATGTGMASTSSLVPPRGLTRSNTSPAYLPSPSRANFELPPQDSPEQPKKEKKTVTIISPRTMDERNRAAQVERLREQQARQRCQTPPGAPTAPSSTAFYFGPNESTLVLESPESDFSSSEDHDNDSNDDDNEDDEQPSAPRQTIRPSMTPYIPEPEWEIITPPSSTATSTSTSTSSSSSSSSSSADSASTAATTTSTSLTSAAIPKPATIPAPAPVVPATRTKRSPSTSTISSLPSRPSLDTRISVDEEDAALKAAVEISIARQISISRQQRRLLRPLGRSGGGGGGGVPAMPTPPVRGAPGLSGEGPMVMPGGMARRVTVGGTGAGAVRAGGADDVTVGVLKGRVTPVMVGSGGVEHRRSERVVLDVA